jgi:glyceraldehyde-3-phosphate dehydrogenase/erythrose-4-phosphate dehydrogenase
MMSIIPISIAAAKARSVIPELNGKMDGMALRVPVSNGSMVNVVLTLKKDVTKEDVNRVLKTHHVVSLRGLWHILKTSGIFRYYWRVTFLKSRRFEHYGDRLKK